MQGEDDEDFDFDNWLADLLLPDLKEPQHGNYDTDWPEYWQLRSAAVDAFPVELIIHCSLDYPMYFLAAKGTDTLASRGNPKAISLPEVSPQAIAALKSFCDRHGVEWREPSWHLFSMWG